MILEITYVIDVGVGQHITLVLDLGGPGWSDHQLSLVLTYQGELSCIVPGSLLIAVMGKKWDHFSCLHVLRVRISTPTATAYRTSSTVYPRHGRGATLPSAAVDGGRVSFLLL